MDEQVPASLIQQYREEIEALEQLQHLLPQEGGQPCAAPADATAHPAATPATAPRTRHARRALLGTPKPLVGALRAANVAVNGPLAGR